MRVVRQLDEGHWQSFVDNHSHGNIFHTPEMFQVFARTRRHRPDVWAVVEDQSEILALFTPVQVTLKDGALRRFTTRSIAYGGILCQETSRGKDALRLLLSTYAQGIQGETLFTELRNLSNTSDLQSLLADSGYVYEPHLDYLIDLKRPAEAVLQSIGPRTRKKIRKGLRDGKVRVDEISDRAQLDEWYTTLRKTYDHAHVPLADRSLFEAAFEVLRPKGMARFLMARVAGRPVACSIELPYKKTIYGWYGGCDRAYGDYVPNELVIWHILAWGANNGYHVYDFGGAGRPGEEYGVRDFKAKFGGKLVDFGRNTCEHTRLLKLMKWGYSVYRKLPRPRAQPQAQPSHTTG